MQKQLPRRFSVRKEVLIEKETLAQVLSCEFYKISKNVFFTKQLWATVSVYAFYTQTEK